jgi:hypothetical protein
MFKLHPQALTALAAILLCVSAQANVVGYSSKAAFDTATASNTLRQTVDFESVASGTSFASGTGTGGVTFSAFSVSFGSLGLVPRVGSAYTTTSGTRYLGLNNADDAFLVGDGFSVNLTRSVQAVGLYVITGSGVQAGDFTLTIPTGSFSNSATPDRTLADGSTAFYIGIFELDPSKAFTSVTFSSRAGPLINFNLDDITSSVPEPGGVALMLAGLASLVALARRRAV